MANIAYYALHKLHIRPSEWLDMEEEEKAFIIASVENRVKKEKEEKEKEEREARRKRR